MTQPTNDPVHSDYPLPHQDPQASLPPDPAIQTINELDADDVAGQARPAQPRPAAQHSNEILDDDLTNETPAEEF